MKLSYLIAGYTLTFDMTPDEYFQTALAPYACALSENPDIYFEIEKTDIAPTVLNDISKRTIGENKYYCNICGSDTVYFYDTILKKIIALFSFSGDYTRISIKALNIRVPNLSPKCFIFNLVGNAFHYIIQMKGGFVFHSSAISCNDRGIAFSAKSGTGKTTHTSLWLQNIPNTIMLNDDTPVIKTTDTNDVKIFGTPWAGTSGRNTNFSIPLKAIVFLKRSETNTISRITPQEAVRPLFDGIIPPLTPAMLSKALNTMDRILSAVPAYLLSCNMNSDAAKVAYEGIFNV